MGSLLRYFGVSFIVLAAMTFVCSSNALALEGLRSGRAEGVISVNVADTTLDKVVAAAKKVFFSNGYKVFQESPNSLVFERPAKRNKDIGYGGLVNEGGTWERVEVLIHDNTGGAFRLECNPSMVTNKGEGMFEDETKVLKLFSRDYRKLMNKVVRELK